METLPRARRSPLQRLAVILAVVVQIGATFLPQFGLGEPIGSRSDSVRTLVTPAGWAFAIWGLLFTGSALFALWQALPAQRENALLARIAWPAAVALAAQGVWATYTQFANLTAISALIILVSLGGLLLVLRALVAAPALSRAERWQVAPVFTALAAWLTAASIVNISATLKYYGLGGGHPNPVIAAVMVAVGAGIAACATARARGAPLYALVFCWALLAIHARGGQDFAPIAWAAIGGGVLVLAAMAWRLTRPDNRRHWLGV